MANRINRIFRELHAHYNVELAETFRQFRAGAIYFAVGLIIVFLANTQLTPSLKQELITLFGLIMAFVGFVIAMLAHMRMLISRIVRFFSRKE